MVSADRCSTFLIQNWDYRPWVEHHAVVVSIDDEKGTHIVGVTEAGQLVRNGMNSWGAGLCANNLTSVFDTGDVGAPVTFVRRKALNSRSFSQLCSIVRSSRRGVSCISCWPPPTERPSTWRPHRAAYLRSPPPGGW